MAQNQASAQSNPNNQLKESSIEHEINLRKAQKAKQQTQDAVKNLGKEAGKKVGGAVGTELGGPIGGFAGKVIGGIAGKKVGTEVNKQLEKSGKINEISQANSLNVDKNKANNQNTGNTGDLAKTVGKELIKSQIKKRIKWAIIASIPTILWFIFWGFVIGLILFCLISVYSCTQKKGLIGTAWTTYTGGFTKLLQESFSGTCLSEGGSQDEDDQSEKKPEQGSTGEATGGDETPKTGSGN